MNEVEEQIPDGLLDRLLRVVHSHTGISMNQGKRNLLQGRLRPRMRGLAIRSYQSYLDRLESSPEERQVFVDLVTTNETSFFRTKKVWEYFEGEFLPSWSSRNHGKTLRIWSAAASSGEEAYTIAVCCEEFARRHPGFAWRITGTDISTAVLARAERGEYSGKSAEQLMESHPWVLDRHFEKIDGGCRVRKELRGKVSFSRHNLFDSAARQGSFDIVFLRNVLIYFQQADQEKVLRRMEEVIPEGGVLVIGESESLGSLATDFGFIAPMIYGRGRRG